MREFETTFAKGLKKGLREDDENPRNQEALVECLNTKPSEEGLIPIVAVGFSVTDENATMAWPFPQVFDRPVADPICDGVTATGYSGADPLAVTADSTAEVTITNGLPPFTWAISGTGLSWQYATTRGRTNILISSGSATGDGSWTATDRCGDETGGDTCVDFEADDDNPETIAPSGEADLAVLCGVSPFTWAVTGTGFTLANAETVGRTNTLIAGASACGLATVTVTDAESDEAICLVRCTTGEWKNGTGCGGPCSSFDPRTYVYEYLTVGCRWYLTCGTTDNGAGIVDCVGSDEGGADCTDNTIESSGDPNYTYSGCPAALCGAQFQYWACA